MISKQKQQTAVFMRANIYMIVLWFRAAAAVIESFLVCEILMHLMREIVIRCSNIISENHVWLITQLVKKINKKKSQKMFKKILIIRKLFSKNVVIIINTKKIKKQLKQNSNWLATVSKKIQINWRKFSVMMHEMWVTVLDYIKQKKTIQQLMRQNRYLKRRIEILHTQWLKRIIKLSKTVICLIVNVISSAQINILIDEELLFQSKLKYCELYHENCYLMQCFKY